MMETELKPLLDEAVDTYNRKAFIENDPILIPHRFSKKEDIEIAAFFAASLAWGNRKSIIQNTSKLMMWMDEAPHEFILQHTARDLKPFGKFVHRTFNGNDCVFFISALKHLYTKHGGLEAAFTPKNNTQHPEFKDRLHHFRELFLEVKHLKRSEKHLSDPWKNSSSKRLCMFLRWMVRKDKRGVDFGIWKSIKASELYLPLDVHTGNVGRQLGLLERKQNDWKAVEEITQQLRGFDPTDPVKYDFALFGLGVNGILK
jgi:uncharacterized protein (TIGR02757 family)